MSRLSFKKVYTVEHNVKVMDVGRVARGLTRLPYWRNTIAPLPQRRICVSRARISRACISLILSSALSKNFCCPSFTIAIFIPVLPCPRRFVFQVPCPVPLTLVLWQGSREQRVSLEPFRRQSLAMGIPYRSSDHCMSFLFNSLSRQNEAARLALWHLGLLIW
jgi:hypothetical protein